MRRRGKEKASKEEKGEEEGRRIKLSRELGGKKLKWL